MSRIVVAGGRDFQKYGLLTRVLIQHGVSTNDEIVSGGARGADRLGETYAKRNNIPLKIFNADWDNLGKKAGVVRNAQMADYADEAIVFWDGQSRGSKNMIDNMTKRNKPVKVIKYSVLEV